MKNMEFRLTGSGGQGVIMLGVILADAAINMGHNAIQSQSYGPEARGGASKCEVIISEEEIDFPKVQKPSLLLSLTQVAYDKYAKDLDGAILIVDEDVEVGENTGAKAIYKLPILRTARDVVGKELTANIVTLGVIQEITKIYDDEELFQCVLKRVPKGSEVLNQRAIDAGHKLVKDYEAANRI
ncbi:2-oxoacid:acceptor oxidoreductase family protein [Guggenheimella bovis]